jgi:hypothetical protein
MLTQFPTEQWDNSGKMPVAYIAISIDELEAGRGIRLTEDVDDLGSFKWAAVRVGSGKCYAFVQHVGASVKSTVRVFADPGSIDLQELADALNIPPTMIVPLEHRT